MNEPMPACAPDKNASRIGACARVSAFQLFSMVIACYTKAETHKELLQCIRWCFELFDNGGLSTMAGPPWSPEEQQIVKENKDLPAKTISIMLANNGYYRAVEAVRSYRYKAFPLWSRKPNKRSQRSFCTVGDTQPIEFTSETQSPCKFCDGGAERDKNDRRCIECSKRASFAMSNHKPEWVGYGSAVWEAIEIQISELQIPGHM